MNHKIIPVFILIFCGWFVSVSSQVRINEFMQSNIDCIMDDLNEFPDSWVELYNGGNTEVNINGWYLSLKKDYNKGFRFSGNYIIPAKGYLILYCDKEGTGLHTDFRLETTKSWDLYLFDSEGNIVDKHTDIPAQPNPNISMGIDMNGDLKYFIESTPGTANSTLTADKVTPDPVFSIPAGIYKSSVTVEISDKNSIPGSKIYYTTDGSEPDEESAVYTRPLVLDKSAVIRAKIIADNYLIPVL